MVKQSVTAIPDKKNFGKLELLSKYKGKLIDWFIKLHEAKRSGTHFDYRLGTPHTGLYSWASRKELPAESGKGRSWFRQPLHTFANGAWEGYIGKGYGAGKVTLQDKGKLLVTNVKPNRISFTLASKKYPERFTLVKGKGTNRQWYLINVTPSVPLEFKKQHYIKVPEEEAEKLFRPGMSIAAKIDGAAAFLKIMKDKVEIVSYRSNKAGKPIVHTERVFHDIPKLDIPKEDIGKVLRGELYGQRKGEEMPIPARELGGLLNSSVARSMKTQKDNKVRIKMQLFNIMGSDKPFSEKQNILNRIKGYLPNNINVAEQVTDPEKQRALFEQIKAKKHPMTTEGIVATPEKGTPYKVKFYDPYRVWIREIFPRVAGPRAGQTAGGFSYSWDPEGPIVGKVGTGFSQDMLKSMWDHPDDWLNRMALVEAEEKFPSGALRGAAFKNLHEDY